MIGDAHSPGDMPATIHAGETVTLSGVVNKIGEIIVNEGELTIVDGTTLYCRGLYNTEGGVLIMGTPESPATAINIILDAKTIAADDPWQWFPGVVNAGHWVANGAVPIDQVYPLPDLGQRPIRKNTDHRRINAITADPDEWQITTESGRVIRAGDCPLNRGVTINGGHAANVHHASYQIDNICFRNSNGTTIALPDDTRVFEDGTVYVGKNQRGRYAFHNHHVHDASDSTITNCVVDGAKKWGFVMHDSPNSIFENCLAWNVEGAGFVREGSLGENLQMLNCIAIGSTGPMDKAGASPNSRGGARQFRMTNGLTTVDGGWFGDGFWVDHALELELRDCGAIGCRYYGINENGYYRNGPSVYGPAPRTGLFAESCFGGYWSTWSQTMSGERQKAYLARTVEFSSNRCPIGIEAWHDARITFVGTLRADPLVSKQSEWVSNGARQTIGFAMSPSYETGGMILNLNITGFNAGVLLGKNTNQLLGGTTAGIRVIGQFSNDIEILGADSRYGDTHMVDIDSINDHRPGCERVPNAPALLHLRAETEHKKDTPVRLNGTVYTLTATSGDIVVKSL